MRGNIGILFYEVSHHGASVGVESGNSVGVIGDVAMVEALVHALAAAHGLRGAVVEERGLKSLSDVFHSHVAGVHHVGGIESIVAQVVHHNLV